MTDATAVMAPAARPPSAATATTSTMKISAVLTLFTAQRTLVRMAPTAIAAGAPIATPMVTPPASATARPAWIRSSPFIGLGSIRGRR